MKERDGGMMERKRERQRQRQRQTDIDRDRDRITDLVSTVTAGQSCPP